MRGSDESFRAEVLDLRVEMMHKAVLIPLGIAGWLGMALSLILLPTEITRALTALAFAGVLILVITCAYMTWSGWAQLALWTCIWGSTLIVFMLVVASQGAINIVWASAACVIAAILAGPATSWAATAVVAAMCAVTSALRPDFAPPPLLALTVSLSAALTFVAQVAQRTLLRSLRRMNEGFEYALEQSDRMRNQSAQLELALKSLGQTSFALARANEQLEIMVQFAEEARRSKQQFAANISHELRTPLNLIIGFSEVILYSPATYYADQLPPKLLADIHTIYRNAQHLLRLVNDILDLSQMDVNYMTIAREPTQVADIIQSALNDFDELIRARGLTLSVEVEPDLPELHADRTRIRQVLLNLFNNALRFTDRGGITVRARPETTTDDGRQTTDHRPSSVVFSVSDTGSGIAEADLQRIFEPFTQADSSPSRRHGGSGLGLTISKRFVELHGGQMWVESQLGKGRHVLLHHPGRGIRAPGERRFLRPHAAPARSGRPGRGRAQPARVAVVEALPVRHRRGAGRGLRRPEGRGRDGAAGSRHRQRAFRRPARRGRVAGGAETHPGVPLPRRWADRADHGRGRRLRRQRPGPHGGQPVQTGDARASVRRHIRDGAARTHERARARGAVPGGGWL